MRRHIIHLIVIAMLGMAGIGYAEDKKEKKDATKDEKTAPVKVEKVKDGVRASYGKDSGVFAEAGGREPSHQEPKGEKHASAGVFVKFGGNNEKKQEKPEKRVCDIKVLTAEFSFFRLPV